MSPMIGAPPDADAEARVKAIIAQLGGGRALMQSMAAYRDVVNRMQQEAPALVKSHPKSGPRWPPERRRLSGIRMMKFWPAWRRLPGET